MRGPPIGPGVGSRALWERPADRFMRRLVLQVLRAASLVLALCASDAAAQSRQVRLVVPESECPSRRSLEAAIAQAAPQAFHKRRAGSPAVAAEIRDLGDGYLVRVAGEERRFRDPTRRCEQRARAVAVLVALVLEAASSAKATRPADSRAASTKAAPLPAPGPATIATTVAVLSEGAAPMTSIAAPAPVTPAAAAPAVATPAPMVAAPPAALAAVVASPRRPPSAALTVVIQATGLVALPPAGDEVAVSGGGGLRATVAKGRVGGALGISGFAPLSMPLEAGRAIITRFPVDLDVRVALRHGRWEGAGELGLVLTALSLRGNELSVNRSSVLVDVGFRAALQLHAWLSSHLGLVAGVDAVVSAQRHDLLVGERHVGVAPRLWLGAGVGLAWRVY